MQAESGLRKLLMSIDVKVNLFIILCITGMAFTLGCGGPDEDQDGHRAKRGRATKDKKDKEYKEIEYVAEIGLEVDRNQHKSEVRQEQMDETIDVLRREIDPHGFKGIDIRQFGDEQISIRVPEGFNFDIIRDLLGRRDLLKFIDAGNEPIPARTRVRFIDDVTVLEEDTGEGVPIDPESEPVASETEIVTGTLQETEEGKYEITPVDDTGAPLEEFEEYIDERIIIITDPNSDKNQVVITGEDMERVTTTFPNGQPVVSFKVSRKAAAILAQHTGKHIGQYMAIILNDEVISCPVIRSRIGRTVQVVGFTSEEAKYLEFLLNAGRIPLPLMVVRDREIY